MASIVQDHFKWNVLNQYLTRHIHQISLFLQSSWKASHEILFSNHQR